MVPEKSSSTVVLEPDYGFNRQEHRSFKGSDDGVSNIFKRSEAKLLEFESDLTANNVKTGAEKSSLRTFPWFYARLTCKALSVNQEILGCNGFQELCGESPPS